MLYNTLVSLAITFFVSAIIGICGFVWYNSFWLWFIVATAAQFVVFFMFNTVYGNYVRERAESIRLEQLREMSKLTGFPKCPCGNNKQPVIFTSLNEPVEYVCESCQKTLKAQTDIVTVLVTNPIYNDRT